MSRKECRLPMKFPAFAAEQGLGRSSGSYAGQALPGVAGTSIRMMDIFTDCVQRDLPPLTAQDIASISGNCQRVPACWAGAYFALYPNYGIGLMAARDIVRRCANEAEAAETLANMG